MEGQTATKNKQESINSSSLSRGILQRKCACGNQAAGGGECGECGKKKQFLQRRAVHISEPGDRYEQEADRVADQVMAAPAQPKVNGTPPRIQRYEGQATEGTDTAPVSVNRVLSSPGSPLDAAARNFFEPRFGRDFSDVRVHTDATAAESARAVNALAYTVGQNIVFGQVTYDYHSAVGKSLLAHELTHVIQQSDVIQRAPEPVGAAQESGEASSAPEPWVMSIIGDTDLSLKTKLRAFAMNFLWGPEPKSEEEFINDLIDPNNPNNKEPSTDEPGLSSDDAAKQLSEHIIRSHAVDKANFLSNADWHASVGSEARKKADSLYRGNPQDVRDQAMKVGILWAFNHQEDIQKVRETALQKYQANRSPQARATLEAATEVLTALEVSQNKPLEESQYSPADAEFAETASRYLGSEKTKKYLEKLGAPLPWFTTCVTMVQPVVEAAGVDTKKWGALDMFNKRTQERFKASEAWVPAEKKEQPKPGDILIFVSYRKDTKGVMQKELSKAFFEHVAILVEPIAVNEDGTEKWVTADGGKGSSHKGEDKTGYTNRRYNPATQQFIPELHTNLQEAAEGGRYLLGFWSLPRLPMRTTGEKR